VSAGTTPAKTQPLSNAGGTVGSGGFDMNSFGSFAAASSSAVAPASDAGGFNMGAFGSFGAAAAPAPPANYSAGGGFDMSGFGSFGAASVSRSGAGGGGFDMSAFGAFGSSGSSNSGAGAGGLASLGRSHALDYWSHTLESKAFSNEVRALQHGPRHTSSSFQFNRV